MKDEDNLLPPLPPDHGFREGDRIEMPVHGKAGKIRIRGTVKMIDKTFGKRRYAGLVVLGDDNRYYELTPEIARKI